MMSIPFASASHMDQTEREINKPRLESSKRYDAPSTDKLWEDLKNLLDEKQSSPKAEKLDRDNGDSLRRAETDLSGAGKEFDMGVLIDAALEAFRDGEDNMNIDATESQTDVHPNDSQYLSSYKERIDHTPKEDGDRGEWTGDRGESRFTPNSEEMKDLLVRFGLEGIDYKDGIPDFAKCSASTVEIDNMTEQRYGPGGNFEQCDAKCAEQWKKEVKDGKTDWTPRAVANWRRENEYSWHERNDMKTCDLVPTAVNDYFRHLGGVSECKKRDALIDGGDFDE